MKHCDIQEIRGNAAASGRCAENEETMACPQPRRLGLNHHTLCERYPLKPLKYQSHNQEIWESKACNELMEIILSKICCKCGFYKPQGGSGSSPEKTTHQVSSSPPFFRGSPPRRVSNPLIQDERFGNESSPAPSTSSARKGGCVRANFGNNPAIRVEGFECGIRAIA